MKLARNRRLIIGLRCVEEVLRHCPERIECVYLASDSAKHVELRETAESAGVPVEQTDRKQLAAAAHSDSHQDIAACVPAAQSIDLKELITKLSANEHALVVMLDSVHDPQNIGSILRAAECTGAAAVIWSKNRGPQLTAALSKASAGACELVPWLRVSNLANALRQFKQAGFWAVAADLNSESVPLYEFEFSGRTVIVFGSEGAGVSRLLAEQVDQCVAIPLAGKIDSLNVGQAAAVVLSWARSGLRWCGAPSGGGCRVGGIGE